MFSSKHPLWLAGFRPFFLLACLAGTSLPLLWSGIFAGWASLTASPVDPLRWHAHEMYFGFGWAVLGGFLLTSTKNWVNIRGYHGPALMLLACAWLVERLTLAFGGHWPAALTLAGSYLFLGSIAAMLLWTLIRYRRQDSYRDNAFFMVMLPTFLVAKALMLHGDFATGHGMALALFRLAFLVMLERTLTQFMKAAFQVQILRRPLLDMPIKLCALLLVAEFALPGPLTAGLQCLLAGLLLVRLVFWHPWLAVRRIDIGIMYVGYLAIVGQLLVAALSASIHLTWVGSVPVHLFTFGAMGCVIPAMIVRIAKGHTGRKVLFDTVDRSILYLMLAALAIRVVLPQFAPERYVLWVVLAGAGWTLAFGLLAWRYVPFLWQARVDGREH